MVENYWGQASGDVEVSETCSVCEEALEDKIQIAFCNNCFSSFHMRMTETAEAKDCGRLWFDEETCATTFLCNPCHNLLMDLPPALGRPPRR